MVLNKKYQLSGTYFIATVLVIAIECNGILIKAQTIDQTMELAKKQYETHDFFSAITTYHRILFFNPSEKRAENYRYLGECYFETGQYDQAAKYYGLSYYSETNDSTKTELIFKSAGCFIHNQDYLAAQKELLNLPDTLTAYAEKKKHFYLAISYWGLNDFVQSEKYFIGSLEEENDMASNAIKQQFVQLHKIRINPKTARILSMILPGAGQLYCGDYKNAFNSFVVNVALLGLYVHVIQAYSLFDALLSVFPWFQRYYTGGIKKSEIIATNKLNEKRNMIYQNILDIIATSKK